MAKILIVEDEAHILRVMSMWLGRHGHDILEASDGQAALDILEHETVDLIITDMNMPVLDGLELIEIVRRKSDLHIPVLLLTARCDQETLLEQTQPFDVQLYPKPFVPSRLVADIEEVLTKVAQRGA
ncbi:MAG: response regulator [Phycisphaerae bacterium]